METRVWFTILIVACLLWLARQWRRRASTKPEISVEAAAESRRRLRQRLTDVSPMGLISANDAFSVVEPDNTETTDNADINPARTRSENMYALARLQRQLRQAEAKAQAAERNELELRRLRKELASIQLERANARKLIGLLEKRIRQQQAILASACRHRNAPSNQSVVKDDSKGTVAPDGPGSTKKPVST